MNRWHSMLERVNAVDCLNAKAATTREALNVVVSNWSNAILWPFSTSRKKVSTTQYMVTPNSIQITDWRWQQYCSLSHRVSHIWYHQMCRALPPNNIFLPIVVEYSNYIPSMKFFTDTPLEIHTNTHSDIRKMHLCKRTNKGTKVKT